MSRKKEINKEISGGTDRERQYGTKELILRFWPYLKKYRGTMCLDLFCAALTTVCELVLPLIMRYITNEGLYNLASLSVWTVGKLGLLYLVLRLIDGAASYYMADMGHVMGAEIETDMRRDAYSHLQKLSNTYYNNTKVGQIMGRITNDLFDVTEFAHHCPEEFFIAAIKTVISFVILAGINLKLTVIIFVCVPLMIGVCMPLNFRMRGAFRKQRGQIGELNARIEDSLLGQKVVKAFTNEEMENAKFEQDNGRFLDIKKETYKYMAMFHTTVKMFDGVMYLAVLVFGALFMINGQIAAGDLVAYMLYVSTLIATIRRIIEFAEQFQRGITGIERFLQIIDADIEIFDEPDAREMGIPKGEICFEDVDFEYPDDKNTVLKKLNLQIHAGEKVAIVGPSGGGKTTLCNLIPRFYDVTEGQVLVDDVDVKQYKLDALREKISIALQKSEIFHMSIGENLAWGKPEADKEMLIHAAEAAQAMEFIQTKPEGMDTPVSQAGTSLSGGQKQRVAIGRAVLKSAEILIFDDATSALDLKTEAKLYEALKKDYPNTTKIIIAQRIASVKDADRIVEMENGRLADCGSHKELLKNSKIYQDIYDSQMKNGGETDGF